MPRDRRPNKIRALDELIAREATTPQKEAIPVIEENPTMSFTDMVDYGFENYDQSRKYSDSHYSDTFYKYFGPPDDELGRSFREIKEKYGTLKNYYDNRYELDPGVGDPEPSERGMPNLDIDPSDLLDNDAVELPSSIYKFLKMGVKIGYELGYDHGFEDAHQNIAGRENQGD